MAIINVGPGQSIQAAINAAQAGDTIVVQSGIYNENLTIDKAIILEGANKGIAPTVPDIDPVGGIDVNSGYRTNEESWIQGTVTVSANDVTVDGFRLRNEAGPLQWSGEPDNFKLINNYVTGYNAANAPTFGDANSNNPTNVVTGWEINSNYVGGLTGGVGGSMRLAGLSNSSISDNTFWRPRAAHVYLASLTNVTIEGNNFFHGLHTDGDNFDGLGQFFPNDGPNTPDSSSYYYGRNYWFELKGTNDTVNILTNTGEFNSGGIQLYSEPDQAVADRFVFNNITIADNTFPTSNFINPLTETTTNGLSGLIPAVMATAAVGGATGTNLVISNNTVSMDLSQIKFETDHKSSLEVRGDFNGVTVSGNTISPTGIDTANSLFELAGLTLKGLLPGQVSVNGNNQFLGGPGTPDGAPYFGIDVVPVDPIYGTFTGNLNIEGNDFDGWGTGVLLRDASNLNKDDVNISGNTFTNIATGRNVFDNINPETAETTAFSYNEGQNRNVTLTTVVASDNLNDTDNVGVVEYVITQNVGNNTFEPFFQIDPGTGAISLTRFGEAAATNQFNLLPNEFNIEVTVFDGGRLTDVGDIDFTVLEVPKTTVTPTPDGSFVVSDPQGNETQITLDGEVFTQQAAVPWELLAVANVGGVSQALWLNPDTAQIGIWNTTSNWEFQSATISNISSLETLQAELDFSRDINGDGFWGDNLVPIESEGSVTLLEGVFNFLHVQPDGGLGTPVKFLNEAFRNNVNSWQALAAETIAGSNLVLFQNGVESVFTIWTTDSNWNYVSNSPLSAINNPGTPVVPTFNTMQAEVSFQVDINGDDIVGDIYSTTIEDNGTVALLRGDYGSIAAQPLDPLTNPIPLKSNGVLFANNFTEWLPLAADVIGGENQVLWEQVATDALWVWDTSSTWNFESIASGPVAPGTTQYQQLLTAFGVDSVV